MKRLIRFNVNTKHILTRIHKYFPKVRRVVDAVEPILVSVTEKDVAKATKKDPKSCALAQAVCRENHADGAIIMIGTSYIVIGDVAYRYKTTNTVAREIVSFDRHHDFAPGRHYRLSAMPPASRLGYRKPHKRKRGAATGRGKRGEVHYTVGIRKSL